MLVSLPSGTYFTIRDSKMSDVGQVAENCARDDFSQSHLCLKLLKNETLVFQDNQSKVTQRLALQ